MKVICLHAHQDEIGLEPGFSYECEAYKGGYSLRHTRYLLLPNGEKHLVINAYMGLWLWQSQKGGAAFIEEVKPYYDSNEPEEEPTEAVRTMIDDVIDDLIDHGEKIGLGRPQPLTMAGQIMEMYDRRDERLAALGPILEEIPAEEQNETASPKEILLGTGPMI